MVPFTFDGIFRTTNMGIPDMTNIPVSTYMTTSYFFSSLLLECTILIVFMVYFGMSIYRVVKKIKNQHFKEMEESQQNDEPAKEQKGEQNEGIQKDNTSEKDQKTNDNLIYKFDQEESEEEEEKKEGGQGAKEGQEEKDGDEEEDDYDNIHDENEEWYIDLDNKMIFLLPFMIPVIVSNGVFATNAVSIICLILTLLCYLIFNIKGVLSRIRILALAFMVPALLGFLPFFVMDHDITS